MELGVWLALVSLFSAGGLTPGPAVMLVVTCSTRYGFRAALVAALGTCAANLFWVGLAVSGAAVLARLFPLAFSALKLTGLGVVAYLAWRMARAGAVDLTRREPPPRRTLFVSGLALQLANPNALVYFGGMLPAYVDPARPLAPQTAVMLLTVTATELFGLGTYAVAANALTRRFASPGFAIAFYRLAALLMLGSASFGVYATWR